MESDANLKKSVKLKCIAGYQSLSGEWRKQSVSSVGQGTPQYVSQELTGLYWHLVHLWTAWGKPNVEILHLGPDLCSLNVLCL